MDGIAQAVPLIDPLSLILARVQFAFTVSFHIVFPSLTIGLASYLAVLDGLYLWRRDPVYRELSRFWTHIFAVTFAMGVVSGIVMAYEFGTNWPRFSEFAGGITGPLLTYEVLTAFFLEAGFLGVMLYGRDKVSPRVHFLATCMVAVGTLISTTWILASNSWMQTPAGFEIVDGRAVPTDWLAVVFNPSFPHRLAHMVLAAYLATALFVAATAAWNRLRGRDTPAIRTMFSMALWMVVVTAPIQIMVGDRHGLNTLEHQPAKIAAMEGHWENEPGEAVPLILFGWPDMKAEETRFALQIPHLGSLILTHSWSGQIPGLKSFPPEDRPNATIVFWSFRVMVGLGVAMLALGALGLWCRHKGRLHDSRFLKMFALAMGPAGIVAILAGWITTEVGRQPWVVYGVMRTADAAAAHPVASMVTTLAVFAVVYLSVFGLGVFHMLRMAARGPHDEARDRRDPDQPERARAERVIDDATGDDSAGKGGA